MNEIDPKALFRLSVLGPVVSRERLGRGELQQLIRELAQREYAIPGSARRHVAEKTIQAWYHSWRKEGIQGLVPKTRVDRGQSRITPAVQEAVLAAKRENPRRSVRQIVRLLEAAGIVASASLSRSAVHRLLQQQGLSSLAGSGHVPEEKRSFAAEFAGSVWYGDVMHGPRVSVKGVLRKTYLVSLIDDASRLVAHSAFCLGETALDVEGVLKQALLRRGVPIKLVVDNGAAYRANTLQGICARLGIHLIFCRPYAPEGKGKLERWHRTLRDQFLSELDERRITDLDDLNARLWAWLEQVYHRSEHAGLGGLTPLARSYLGQRFEVPYELSGKTVRLVADPHAERVVGVEDAAGQSLGLATALDALANIKRVRRKPEPAAAAVAPRDGPNLVEIAHRQYHGGKANDVKGA